MSFVLTNRMTDLAGVDIEGMLHIADLRNMNNNISLYQCEWNAHRKMWICVRIWGPLSAENCQPFTLVSGAFMINILTEVGTAK